MKMAIQLYSLREVGDFRAQLALARRAGFEWVETVANHDLPPAEFAATVQAAGLKVASMHVALARLEGDRATIVEACRTVQCPLVVMPWLPVGERGSTGAAWKAMGERLAAIGDALAAEGLKLAYHNHEFEFLVYDGRPALDWLFGAASPEQLGWEADLGWVGRAGADPFEWIERHGDRLAAVHAKDIAPPRTAVDEDGWAILGQGTLPWVRLLAQLKSRVDLAIFEHDKPRDPERAARESRAFLAAQLAA
jgi:sugar phosphate isomerase/epimerase